MQKRPTSFIATRSAKPTHRAGFSIVQMAIILTTGALVAVSALPSGSSGDKNRKATDSIAKLQKVEDAMRGRASAYFYDDWEDCAGWRPAA